ncbi:MAG: alpha/beta hydrolase family protein [Cephaloticoccus sp.]
MIRFNARPVLLSLLGLCAHAAMADAPSVEPGLRIAETPSGVRYGLWGREPAAPAPLLIILSASIEESLGEDYFRQCGTALAQDSGYVCVSIDLPAHGPQQRADERRGLDGWRDRVDRGEDFVAENNARLHAVVDHLVATGVADANRIAACGTSRGGFMAMHYAAADPRVRCVAAFAPVTDLVALREFAGAETGPLVAKLALRERAADLAARSLWVIIGDRDVRVDTDAAIALVRAVTAAALAAGVNPQAEIHVLPEPKGHTTPAGAPAAAAAWIAAHTTP